MKEKTLIEKVSQLFLENGAKTVTMDDIAKELGMSKKTLYQQYKNKDMLLEDVLAYGMNNILETMENLDNKIDNAIERMFSRDEDIERASRTNDSILLRQLIKYYPHIFNKHILLFSEKFSDILVHNIERGRAQGYYREDFDANFYAKIFFQLIMSYNTSPYLNITDITRPQFHHEALMFYMNAITTEKGKEYIRSLGDEKFVCC